MAGRVRSTVLPREGVSCCVQSNRTREATLLPPWSCSFAVLAFTYQKTACASGDPANLNNSDDSVFTDQSELIFIQGFSAQFDGAVLLI